MMKLYVRGELACVKDPDQSVSDKWAGCVSMKSFENKLVLCAVGDGGGRSWNDGDERLKEGKDCLIAHGLLESTGCTDINELDMILGAGLLMEK